MATQQSAPPLRPAVLAPPRYYDPAALRRRARQRTVRRFVIAALLVLLIVPFARFGERPGAPGVVGSAPVGAKVVEMGAASTAEVEAMRPDEDLIHWQNTLAASATTSDDDKRRFAR